MLERLQLRNFQRHDDFRLQLDERVTTIVGTSDAGKSSVLRALRWLMTGKPFGSAFVRHGQTEAAVVLWLDGHKLSRRKGRGVNKMVLDGAELEAFGTELPESVTLLCNVDESNFQGQHDPPFWLSLTAGQASRELNAVVNLEAMDGTLSAVAAEARRAKTVVELTQERIKQCEERLASLGWVEEMSRDWRRVETLQKRRDESERTALRAGALLREVKRSREQAAVEVPDTVELDDAVLELERREQKVRSASTQLREARRLTILVESCGEEIDVLQTRLSVESGGVCPLCGAVLDEEN